MTNRRNDHNQEQALKKELEGQYLKRPDRDEQFPAIVSHDARYWLFTMLMSNFRASISGQAMMRVNILQTFLVPVLRN